MSLFSKEITKLAVSTYHDAMALRGKGRVFLGDLITEKELLVGRRLLAEEGREMTPADLTHAAKTARMLYTIGDYLVSSRRRTGD